ncbi:hypothetical protein [Halpernia frigidisoli]|uniref:Glycine zipper family protein n=1 Tax=Halpernia frigidisoli TaxID=1125876 RepID=A0A1I3GY67_9FLAO|nr:hypothetical protein [Halpernia frigidisoli]SFI28306.1 hypothetical protein SAMN05443292_2084 [Halpernia frigidisoli]
MSKILLLAVFLFSNFYFSQVTIESNHLVKDGKSYKLSQYEDVLQSDAAKSYVKKARTNNTVGQIFAGVGGASLGFGLARALSGGKTTITINGTQQIIKQNKTNAYAAMGVGAGLIGIGVPFILAANKNLKKGIAAENGEVAKTAYFKIEAAGNGFALSYNF